MRGARRISKLSNVNRNTFQTTCASDPGLTTNRRNHFHSLSSIPGPQKLMVLVSRKALHSKFGLGSASLLLCQCAHNSGGEVSSLRSSSLLNFFTRCTCERRTFKISRTSLLRRKALTAVPPLTSEYRLSLGACRISADPIERSGSHATSDTKSSLTMVRVTLDESGSRNIRRGVDMVGGAGEGSTATQASSNTDSAPSENSSTEPTSQLVGNFTTLSRCEESFLPGTRL
mmetsp:Transcript_41662/g.110262  ORF Transcript_41662/g.110262 Transcript_41662/m.110262 type:complete len:230 (+) Transcript_41662:106-795(+)